MFTYSRSHFRVAYPVGDRPKIRIAGVIGEVIDLSEKGVSFSVAAPQKMSEADLSGVLLRAKIVFLDGSEEGIEGRVVRHTDPVIALTIENTIPLARMMAEHRAIIQRYPTGP